MSARRQQPVTLSALTHEWNTARNASNGWPLFLESVQIDGLRGWTNETVEFRFPVVAVAGENGAGKSTVLKSVAAAYQGDGVTFYPDDFFPNTPWEKVEGVSLRYQIRQGDTVSQITLRKPTSRWRGMPDRTRRPVFFLDISRTQPINTLVGYGKIAKQLSFEGDVTPFQEPDRALLSRIMNKPYTTSSMATYENKQIGVLSTSVGEYSNFHQGAGEDATADLVALLRTAPRNSLVVIDEVEASLHPRAQRRLMTELLSISREKRMQFVLSTHSATILEQLPTEARLYIQLQRGGARNLIYGATADFAMSLMDDAEHPELALYCEDDQASVLVDALISQEAPDIRNRVQVIPAGAASTVRTLGELAAADKLSEPSLCILDGDQAPATGCITIPGTRSPEEEVFGWTDELLWEKVASRLDVRVGDLMEALDDARQIDNHHAWARRIAERLGPRVRVGRVWEDAASIWARDVVDPAARAAFVEAIVGRLPR